MVKVEALLFFLASTAVGVVIGQEEDPPVVTTSSGDVVGRWVESWQGTTQIASFNGIPYGKPPVNELRYLPPEPADPWTDPLDASAAEIPVCLQAVQGGEEDCLMLVVNTPAPADEQAMLPVMVYFHGGAFKYGSALADYNPEFLADFGVVTASVQYRLGPLGFLSVEGTAATGNQGLRDQILALEWVRDNIRSFGGDPDRVTLFGESAGSWSSMFHVLSPKSDGLFAGAVGQSGTPVGKLWGDCRDAEEDLEAGREFVEMVGCDDVDVSEVLQCLQETPAELLIEVDFVARGVVDGSTSSDPVMPRRPEDLLNAGDFSRVPVLLGANSMEATLFNTDVLLDADLLDSIGAEWDARWGVEYIFNEEWEDATEEEREVAVAAREFYFQPDGVIDQTRLVEFLVMNTDAMFQYGVHSMSLALSEYVPVYQYMLVYTGSLSFLNVTHLPTHGFTLGACHTDDLPYLFRNYPAVLYEGDAWDEQDETVRLRMLQMWTNFAKTGDPTTDQTQYGELGDFKWLTVGEAGEDGQYLELGPGKLVMTSTQEYKDRMEFWIGQVGLN